MELLQKVYRGETLDHEEAYRLMQAVMAGALSPAETAGLLIGLKVRGEQEEEIAGFARAMREAALEVQVSHKTVDIVGTGGDGKGTFNISTASAFVAAAAGAKVAKHGNRAASSRSGSADVLEALGAKIDLAPQQVARLIDQVGIGFIFARTHHPAMKHVAPVRAELKTRTVFNLLGPLTNPARPSYFVLGVFSPQRLVAMAQALKSLGVERALVVHGEGTDELVLGENQVVELSDGEIRRYTLRAEEVGLSPAPLDALAGGSPEENAALIRRILAGEESGPARDVVALNAGAAIYAAGLAESLAAGVARARELLTRGEAKTVLERFVAASNHAP